MPYYLSFGMEMVGFLSLGRDEHLEWPNAYLSETNLHDEKFQKEDSFHYKFR